MNAPEADPLGDWLDAWLRLGLSYDDFWRRTPREADRILRAEQDRIAAAHDRERSANHELAVLIGFAFHDPKKMPEFKPALRAQAAPDRRLVSDEADEVRVRAYLMAMAMRSS